MFKQRSVMMFIAAVGLGLGATWMANKWIHSRMTPVAKVEEKTTPVVVAALEIPYSQKIEAAQLKTVNWPSEQVPAGAFTEVSQVEGKIANGTIYPNEVVIQGRVVEHDGGSSLAAMVAPNLRAVTVRVNDVVGVAGFLLPGNRVDVIATRKDNNNRRSQSQTILQNLRVLAVDQTAAPEADKPVVVRAVTLEMTPKQAERLVKATDEGNVQLALRNPTDGTLMARAEKKPADPAKVAAPAPREPAFRQVTVIRGVRIDKTQIRL
ncbi:MAG: Flp pilus assembly protein CpaB [Gammaproteobacteria bacterium]